MAKLSYGTIITWHTLPRDTTSWKQQKLLHYIYLLHRKNIFGTVTVCVKSFSSGLLSLSLSLVFRPKCSKLCSIQGVIYEKHVCCVYLLYTSNLLWYLSYSVFITAYLHCWLWTVHPGKYLLSSKNCVMVIIAVWWKDVILSTSAHLGPSTQRYWYNYGGEGMIADN